MTAFYRQSEQPWRFGLFTVRARALELYLTTAAPQRLASDPGHRYSVDSRRPLTAAVIFWAIGNTTGTALAPWRYIFVLRAWPPL